MAIAVNLNGAPFSVPEVGDTNWAANLTLYLQALATAFPQAAGSVGFSALTSATANPATSGQIRLAKTDSITWRNVANSGQQTLYQDNTTGALSYVTSAGAVTQLSDQPLAVYQTNATQSIPTSSATIVNFGTVVTDTDSAVTTGAAWKFTIPPGKGGSYFISANVRFSGLAANSGIIALSIFTNGGQSIGGPASDTSNGATQGYSACGVLNLTAGSTIDVRVFQGQGVNRSLSAVFAENSISIKRLV